MSDPFFDDDDDEDAQFEAQLYASLGIEPPPPPPAVALPEPEERSRKPRYYCNGAKRVDERTGKKQCEYKAPERWYGRCPGCWNYYDCLPMRKGANAETRVTLGAATMAAAKPPVYIPTLIPELDRVINGGVVTSRTLLLGGGKGGGKTTMLLRACDGFARDGRRAYFASGEMTQEFVIEYARRLGITNENITLFADPSGIDVRKLTDDVLATKSRLVILDSIQVAMMDDVKGDLGQAMMLDAVTNWMTSFAQAKKRAVIMIGHLEKQGNFAGTEKMLHLVDGLVRFDKIEQGDPNTGLSVDTGIRKIWVDGKLRQGPADVTAYVEMSEEGIRTPSASALRRAGLLG